MAVRALERLADARFDPILVDCSYWRWAERDDEPPAGLMDAGQRDIDTVFTELEATIRRRARPWPFGAPGLTESAWFPNLIALRALGFSLDEARFPATHAWLLGMRAHPVFVADRKRTVAFLKMLKENIYEHRRIFWRGDRIEWLLSRGFHKWFLGELEAGRAIFPA